MKRVVIGLIAVVSLLVFGACSDPATSTGAGQAPASGSAVDAATFKQAIALDNTVVLDVRTPAEYATGHIEGAVNIDVEAPTFDQKITELDKSKHYAVYCRTGNRSQVALGRMQSAGFGSVYHLAGGITAWQAAGYPVQAG